MSAGRTIDRQTRGGGEGMRLPWAEERLTRDTFPRSRFKEARRRAGALWNRAVLAEPLAHAPVAAEGHFLALELGDLLLSTLDMGSGQIGWRFAACAQTGTGGSAARLRETRPPLLMLRCLRGGELAMGERRMALPAGQIALVPLQGPVVLMLAAGGRADIGILAQAPAALSGPVVLDGALPSGHLLAFFAGYLLRCAPHPPGRAAELRGMLLRALEHVTADLMVSLSSGGETPFERFRFLVAANLGRPELSLGEIAAAMGLGPRRLQRLLKENGTTFRAHLLHARLLMAREVIETSRTRPRIADLAYRCGFSDPNYFSRAYAQHWNAPPSRMACRSTPRDQTE
ncbi:MULTISPECIES: helix-turn-helix transcriptional regulator [unclassified Haematobacter]|uniref:helix-turn-helix transcriptional regulator n=1 Tax=unclassified Haematobacter TaxID=2640585 RepID=UPI0025C30318|nr:MULTISPECIES: helix-turn-helix transcriptional regulator [unclassified Haematobacter]